jgi:NAD+ synthase (glutamine-hydrolysing)
VAAEALGPENVLGIAMPADSSPPDELENARDLADRLGIELCVIPLGEVSAAIVRGLDELLCRQPAPESAEPAEAHEARVRATLLWTAAARLGYVPLATGNKSELAIGATTLFGDMAGAFAPLKDCPKSMVYRLALVRNARGQVISDRILGRAPSVQVDRNHTLPGYNILDPIVERYLERGYAVEDLVEQGFDPAIVRGVLQLVDNAELKRRQAPPGPKISSRAFGQDLRMPITNEWRPFRADEAELLPPEAQPDAWPPAQPAGVGEG